MLGSCGAFIWPCWGYLGPWLSLSGSISGPIGCGRMCSWEENARGVSLSPDYLLLGLAWTEAVSIKFRVALECSIWVGKMRRKFRTFFQGTLELELYRRLFWLTLDWVGFWFYTTLNFELYIYSDGLGTISQFIAIKFGPQLSAGIHRGGYF